MSLAQMAHSNAQEVAVHHAANAAAIVIPAGAAMFNLPNTIVLITAILGALWYIILIAEKIATYRRRWLTRTTTITKVVEIAAPTKE